MNASFVETKAMVQVNYVDVLRNLKVQVSLPQ